MRKGNVAYAAGLGLLMLGDPGAASGFAAPPARWRESWQGGESSGAARSGALKASLLAATTRGRGARALDARARRGDGRVADRPLRRHARVARARGAGPRRATSPSRCGARRLSARRRRCARDDRGARRRRLRPGARLGRHVVRDARGLPRGRAGRRHGARARCCAPPASPSELPESPVLPPVVGFACADRRVERDRDRLQRRRVVLELRSSFVGRARASRPRTVSASSSRAPASCRSRRSRRVRRSRAAARGAAPPGARWRDPPRASPRRRAALRDRPVRLLAPVDGGELDQAGAVQHPHVEVEVARVDGEPLGELAVRQRLVRRAERLQHLQASGGCPSAFSCRRLELEDVVGSASARASQRSLWPPRPGRGRPRPEPVRAGRGWPGGGVDLAGERAGHRVGLVGAGDEEDDPLRRLDRRQRERHALDERLEPGRPGGGAAVGHLELRRAGEERGHVRVGPEPEQQQVELDAGERRVAPRRPPRPGRLAADPVHGLRRHREPVEQRSSRGGSSSARRRRHAALVAPPDGDTAPVRLAPRASS